MMSNGVPDRLLDREARKNHDEMLGIVQLRVCLQRYDISVSRIPAYTPYSSICSGGGGHHDGGKAGEDRQSVAIQASVLREGRVSIEPQTHAETDDEDNWSLISADECDA